MVGIFPCLLQKTSLAIWYSRKLSLTLSWKSSSKRSTCKHISQLMRQKESLSTAWKKTHTHTYHTSTENASQEDAQCTKNKASWFYTYLSKSTFATHDKSCYCETKTNCWYEMILLYIHLYLNVFFNAYTHTCPDACSPRKFLCRKDPRTHFYSPQTKSGHGILWKDLSRLLIL